MSNETASPISDEELRRAEHDLTHQVMAAMHMAIAHSGLTYEQVSAKIGRPVDQVRRAFYDEKFAGEPDSLPLCAEIMWALDTRLQLSLLPRDPDIRGEAP